MGIKVEYNPDLALRDITEHKEGRRQITECVPENLIVGKTYQFLKRGQRLYWLDGEIPLLKTKGNEDLSAPVASIVITEATHIKQDNEIWTKGFYTVVEIFIDSTPRFNGFAKIQTS